MIKRTLLFLFAAAILVAGAVVLLAPRLAPIAFAPTPTHLQQGVAGESGAAITDVAQDLTVPWKIVFLSAAALPGIAAASGEIMLITERTGTLAVVGDQLTRVIVPDVAASGEGGLLGFAASPNFAADHWLYFYLTAKSGTSNVNRVMRFVFDGTTLMQPTVIITGIAGADFHDGGQIDFGPDGMLYISTGDAGNSSLAQNTKSLSGKILRLHPDGSIPDDNPFSNAVWSYGHRNPQGLAWDDRGRLWETEHGRSGAASGYDELNLIEKGKNYGWPEIQGPETRAGMVTPVLQSGPDETWAPGGLAFLEGTLYFSGLRGQSLYMVRLGADGNAGTPVAYFRKTYGRLRAVTAHNGALFVSTSNRDGRGSPRAHDDRVMRIPPAKFLSSP